MGIFKAAKGAADGVLADQWLEFISCPSLPATLLAQKGEKQTGARSANVNGSAEVISAGSKIAVADGQCALALENGKVTGVYGTPGEHTFQSELSGSLFSGAGVGGLLHQAAYRFGFGGDAAVTQRVLYLNMKELPGNPFAFTRTLRIKSGSGEFDLDLVVDFSGVFSFRITDPLVFYKSVCGNVQSTLPVSAVQPQLVKEIAAASTAALASLCKDGLSPTALIQTVPEVCELTAAAVTEHWQSLRGFSLVSLAFSGVSLKAADQMDLKRLEQAKALSDPIAAAGCLAAAQADALRAAALNPAGLAGAAALLTPKTNAPRLWRCPCGALNTGKFCESCGKPRPA